jgi:hypothetical protein
VEGTQTLIITIGSYARISEKYNVYLVRWLKNISFRQYFYFTLSYGILYFLRYIFKTFNWNIVPYFKRKKMFVSLLIAVRAINFEHSVLQK